MKKLLTVCCAAGISFGLCGSAYSAAEEELYQANEKFEQAKLAIALDKPNALQELSVFGLLHQQEKVQALLDTALRVKNGKHTQEYIDILTTQLQKDTPVMDRIRQRSSSLRRSETLTLLDVAIMQGQVGGVKKLLQKTNADTTKSRLLGTKENLSAAQTVDKLIKAQKNNVATLNGLVATADQLVEIRKLIDAHNKAHMSPFQRLAYRFTKK